MRRRGLSLDQLWIGVTLTLIALRVLLTPIPPHDFWWHMATGREIVASGQIPTVDGFSYSQAGQPFYNQSWLAQVGLYALFQLGGAPLLVVVQALMLALAYGLLLQLCIRQSGELRLSVGFLLLGTVFASFDNWVVRPQSYAIPLFMGYLYLLTVWRTPRGPRKPGFWLPLLILPLLGALWVNLHGSFVLGGALIGLTFVGEALRRVLVGRDAAQDPFGPAPPLWHLVVAGSLTGLSWLINPGGLQVLTYVRNLLGSSQVSQLVVEWAPPTTQTPGGTIFFLFVLAGIVILAYARRSPNQTDMLVAGAFLWLALGATRHNLWFVAVATPLLVRQLATWRPEHTPRRAAYQGLPLLNGVVAGLLGLILVLALPWVKPILALPPEVGSVLAPSTPVEAVQFMQGEAQRPSRLFHDMSYGSYLIWATPEQKVWIDPRIELFPFEQWRTYQQLSAGEDSARLIEAYGFDGLLLSNLDQAGLVAWAESQAPDWELRFRDAQTSYFVRRP
ncbi:MAG: hypothetical protein AB4911_02065 [Oscillochloridaceae bacterium umkhey_bin13]